MQDLSETRLKSETRQQYRPMGIKRYTAKLNLKGISFFTHPVYFAIIKKLIVPIAKCKINFCTMFAFMIPLLCNLRCYLLFNAVVTKKTAKIFEGLRTYQRAFDECTPRRPNMFIIVNHSCVARSKCLCCYALRLRRPLKSKFQVRKFGLLFLYKKNTSYS